MNRTGGAGVAFIACLCLLAGSLTAEELREGSPVLIARGGRQPRVAVRQDGTVFVVYGAGDSIFCVASIDGGQSYAKPVEVGRLGGLMLGRRRGPQVVATRDFVIVSAIRNGEGNLVAWRSVDGGATWRGPVRVNDRDASAREGLHAMAAGPGNRVYAAWLDLRDGRTKLFGSRSKDGGASWSSNRLIYESPDGTICECCQPSVAVDRNRHVSVMWRNALGGARDMYLALSLDGGKTFGGAQKLGEGTWPLKACPMDGGGLAVDRAGRATTIWRRDRTLFLAVPGRPEMSLGDGAQGSLSAGPGGLYAVWERKGEILEMPPGQTVPRSLGEGRFPAVAAAPGDRSPVVAVWEQSDSNGVNLVGVALAPVAGRSTDDQIKGR